MSDYSLVNEEVHCPLEGMDLLFKLAMLVHRVGNQYLQLYSLFNSLCGAGLIKKGALELTKYLASLDKLSSTYET